MCTYIVEGPLSIVPAAARVCGTPNVCACVCIYIGEGPLSIVPRQREFAAHLKVLNDKLKEMIDLAR
jgi:hypothetical protein